MVGALVTFCSYTALKHHIDVAREFAASSESPAERFGKRIGLGILASGWIANLAATPYLYLTTPGFNFSDPRDGVVTHALAETAGVALKLVIAAGSSVIVAGYVTDIAAKIGGFVSEVSVSAVKGAADGIRSLHKQYKENQETKLQF